MSLSSILMGLGSFRFSIKGNSYQTLERTISHRYAAQERLGSPISLQSLGAGEDTISMRGTIYPHYHGGISQIESMRNKARHGKPLMMVSGLGNIFGKWVIKEVKDTQSYFTKGGSPRKVEFTITLQADNDKSLFSFFGGFF